MEYEVVTRIFVRASDADDAEAIVETAIQGLRWATEEGPDEGVLGYSVADVVTP